MLPTFYTYRLTPPRGTNYLGNFEEDVPQTNYLEDSDELPVPSYPQSSRNRSGRHGEDTTLFRRRRDQNDLCKNSETKRQQLRNAGSLVLNQSLSSLESTARADDNSSRCWESSELKVNGVALHNAKNKNNTSPIKDLFLERPEAPLKKLPGVYYPRASRSTLKNDQSQKELWFEHVVPSAASSSSKIHYNNNNEDNNYDSLTSYSSSSDSEMDDFWALFK